MRFTPLLFTAIVSILTAQYNVGDQISTDHQNLSFDVCYGDYETDQLSLLDFADGNTVIWINMSASW